MKKEEIYRKYIKGRWEFAQNVTKNDLKEEGHAATTLSLAIFEKCTSPLHYFLENRASKTEAEPTEKQIEYAKKLGIKNPENYTKQSSVQKSRRLSMNNQIILPGEIGCSSFKLTKTTKGYTWSIKIYNTDVQKGYDMDKEIDKQANKDYGYQEGN